MGKGFLLLIISISLISKCASSPVVKEHIETDDKASLNLVFDYRNLLADAGWGGFTNEFFLNNELLSTDFMWNQKIRKLGIPNDSKTKISFKIRNYIQKPFRGMTVRSTQSDTLVGLESRFLQEFDIDLKRVQKKYSVVLLQLKITTNKLEKHFLETFTDVFLFPIRWMIGQFPTEFQRIGYDVYLEDSELGAKISPNRKTGKIKEILNNGEIVFTIDDAGLNLTNIYLVDDGNITYGKVIINEVDGNNAKGSLICKIESHNLKVGDNINLLSKTIKINENSF